MVVELETGSESPKSVVVGDGRGGGAMELPCHSVAVAERELPSDSRIVAVPDERELPSSSALLAYPSAPSLAPGALPG